MASKTLFESVMYGTSKQVQDMLGKLTFDDNYTDYALLMTALRRKRKEISKILLNNGCRARKPQPKDKELPTDTPLHLAVKLGDADIVKLLLEKGGADVNALSESKESVLYFAIKRGCCDEIVDLILSASSADCPEAGNKNGFLHFHMACLKNKVGLVEKFLKKGVNVNSLVDFSSDEYPGYTALHFAVENNCLDVVKLLLSYNADPTVKNAEGKTPLRLAMQNDEIASDILSLTADKNYNPIDEDGLSHFHIACMRHHYDAVQRFLQRGVDINLAVKLHSYSWPGYTALHFAVKGSPVQTKDQIAVIELLLRHKADVNAKDKLGHTPLHLACLQSDEKISKLIQSVSRFFTVNEQLTISGLPEISAVIDQMNQVEIVDLLLRYKSYLNEKNLSNETPLFCLYKHDRSKISSKVKYDKRLIKYVINRLNEKRIEILKILLNRNADVNVTDDTGQTLLHQIASIDEKYDDDHKEEAAGLILAKVANANAKAKNGSMPLHLAAKNGHAELIELLLRHGAQVNACQNSYESTPLHVATANQQVKAIEVLLAHGADVNAVRSNGMNVLHTMAMLNPESSPVPEFISSYDDIIKAFVEHGCDIDAQDINGRTPLHHACWEYNVAATWNFLQHFADINVQDFSGETPLALPRINTSPCMAIHRIIKDFVIMIKLAGLPFSKKNKECFLHRHENVILDENDDLMAQCNEEIEKMKLTWINNHTSLFDIMFKSPREMVVYTGNEVLQKILNDCDFEVNFNIYKYLLKSQFRKGLARKNLLTSAKESLEFMIGLGLPDSCSDKILQYLTNKCLNDLVKAKTVKITDKKMQVQQNSSKSKDSASLEMALAYFKKLSSRQVEMDVDC